jgi:hypothetical protein
MRRRRSSRQQAYSLRSRGVHLLESPAHAIRRRGIEPVLART